MLFMRKLQVFIQLQSITLKASTAAHSSPLRLHSLTRHCIRQPLAGTTGSRTDSHSAVAFTGALALVCVAAPTACGRSCLQRTCRVDQSCQCFQFRVASVDVYV